MSEVEAKAGSEAKVVGKSIDEEKEKALKTGYISFISNFFMLTGSVLKYGV